MRHQHHKPKAFQDQFQRIIQYSVMTEKYINSLKHCYQALQNVIPQMPKATSVACEERYNSLLVHLKRHEIMSPGNIMWSFH